MRRFNTLEFLRVSEAHLVTHAMLVPAQYRRLMDDPAFGDFDLTSYRMKFCTSAPLPADLKREVLARWPGDLLESYGMTEGGAVSFLPAHERPDKLHTVGKPAVGHVVWLIDHDGRVLPPGATGEVVGHSASIMTGYLNRPEESAAIIWTSPDGRRFVRTGDIGRFDDDGFLTLVDRKKDMINSGGFNVYPSDIEAVLRDIDDVAEAAVVGVPSPRWGENACSVRRLAASRVVVSRGPACLGEQAVVAATAATRDHNHRRVAPQRDRQSSQAGTTQSLGRREPGLKSRDTLNKFADVGRRGKCPPWRHRKHPPCRRGS